MKNKLPSLIFLIALSFLILQPVRLLATHIVGGELNYRCIGNNQYEITLRVFRDCFNGVPPFDDPAAIGVFDINNNLIQTINIPFPGSVKLDPVASTPVCARTPTNVCVEVAEYKTTVTLPPRAGGYQLSYQRCCRNQTIVNLVNPGNTGDTFYALIPDPSIASCNSNPVIKEWPPVFVCANMPLVVDHSATDYDGDSLVYELCDPYTSGTNPAQPNPPANPPYNYITWQSPYNASNPMGGLPPLSINSKTGLLTGTPDLTGQYVVGVCVKEYRNGKLISQTKRDFQFNVVTCNPVAVAAALTASVDCFNHTIKFTNKSTGSSSWFWDFGDLTSTTDTSTQKDPTWNYPAMGTYTITLIAYATADPKCNDTVQFTVKADTCNPRVEITKSCQDTCLVLTANVIDIQPPYTFSWNNGLPSTAGPHTICDSGTTKIYTLTVTVAGGSLVLTDTDTLSTFKCGNYECVCMNNPGLEGPPMSNSVPLPWVMTLQSPDVHNCWGGSCASEGATWVGIANIGGGASGYEEFSQQLCAPLDSGKRYALSVDLSSDNAFPFTHAASLEIYGSNTLGGNDELLWSSPGVLGPTWITFFVVFKPSNNYNYITMASGCPGGGCSVFTGTYLHVDNFVIDDVCGPPPVSCDSMQITTSSSSGSCSGSNNGSATVSVVKGNPNYIYLWSKGQTTPAITGLSPGTYTVTVTDKQSCSAVAEVIVTEPQPICPECYTFTNVKCKGGSDGSVTVQPKGGMAPYTYSWSNSATTASIQGLQAGLLYTVTVTDNSGCTSVQVYSVKEPDLLTVTATSSPASCKGDNEDGTISASPAGGVTGNPSYSYIWSNGQTSSSAGGTPPGTYTVTVTDYNGCTKTASVVVTGELSCEIRIPNIITPDGKGNNDNFIIAGLEKFPNSRLVIYNRWGTLIYESTDYRNDWEGRHWKTLNRLNDGVYYYILTLENGDTYPGYVTLLRGYKL